MARYTGPACKICRRENQKLFLKGDRCMTEKCAFERRPYPPGQHGHGRIKFSEYAMQLREKQKLKRTYGLQEGQFHSYFVKAETMKGVTGSNLLTLLERRLDNVIYRSGFATSRAQARIMVRHGHLMVNGKKVSIPSFLTRKGDQLMISANGQKQVQFQAAIESSKSKEMPNWLDVDRDQFKSVVKDLPTREDITMPIEERMVVELYSK